ncbi:hypothetical protein DL96DRAFT_1710971 [Flagelloscypha sp. PMI_526]|nr:hypothetical protein DL96DRAFT_1710971 [Flagelloscypha sp. PMI_526]
MRRYSPSHIRGYKLKPSPHTIAVQSRPKLHSPIPLPIELLFEIFLFAVSTLDVLDLQVGEGISMLPMTLGHVSRIWRQAATLSPVLWSFFRIHTGALDRHFIPKLEICLERSETCLLDLVVTTGDSELGDTPRITTYLFDRLAFYSQRWVSISVDFDGYRYSHPQCLESLQKPLKLLHLRTVRLYYVSYLPPCFKAALNVGTLDIRLSWSQAAAPFLPPLPAGFPALETLSVVGAGTAEHEHYLRWPKTLTLPNLVSLELKQSCYILHVFECPKLHTLCLSNNDISGDYPETAILDRELAAFLARTPSLQTFRHHPVTSIAWLKDQITSSSLLEHLDLKLPRRNVTLVLALMPVLHSPPVLSCLKSISLSFTLTNWFTFNFEIVEEFLRLLPNRDPTSTHCTSIFPAIERIQLSIALLSRPESYIKEEMVWYHQWRNIEDTILPGAMSLKVAFPKDGVQNGVEVIDLEKWLGESQEQPNVAKRRSRARWLSFGSIFR